MNRYPDPGHGQLRRAIAAAHGLQPERIACGAGSMELMELLATAYCEPGVDVVVSRLGYKYFELRCAFAGATPRAAPEPRRRVDPDAILDTVTGRTRLVYIANPNNPTGTCLEDRGLVRLRARLPDRVMLVVDEAYAEFAAGPDYETGIDLVESGHNVVVLRTFSKAYGLAGLRVGWLYAHEDVIGTIGRIRPPNSITAPGLAAAEAALDDRPHLARVLDEIARLREAFRRHVRELGLEAGPSRANFVLVRFPEGRYARRDRGVPATAEGRNHRASDRRLRALRLPARDHRVGRRGWHRCRASSSGSPAETGSLPNRRVETHDHAPSDSVRRGVHRPGNTGGAYQTTIEPVLELRQIADWHMRVSRAETVRWFPIGG